MFPALKPSSFSAESRLSALKLPSPPIEQISAALEPPLPPPESILPKLKPSSPSFETIERSKAVQINKKKPASILDLPHEILLPIADLTTTADLLQYRLISHACDEIGLEVLRKRLDRLHTNRTVFNCTPGPYDADRLLVISRSRLSEYCEGLRFDISVQAFGSPSSLTGKIFVDYWREMRQLRDLAQIRININIDANDTTTAISHRTHSLAEANDLLRALSKPDSLSLLCSKLQKVRTTTGQSPLKVIIAINNLRYCPGMVEEVISSALKHANDLEIHDNIPFWLCYVQAEGLAKVLRHRTKDISDVNDAPWARWPRTSDDFDATYANNAPQARRLRLCSIHGSTGIERRDRPG